VTDRRSTELTTASQKIPVGTKTHSNAQSGRRLVPVKTPTGCIRQHAQRNVATTNRLLVASTTHSIAINQLWMEDAIKLATYVLWKTTGMIVNTLVLLLVATKTLSNRLEE